MHSTQSLQRSFWLVWNPANTRSPEYRHFSEASAINEAERLAAAYPGATFVVLHSVCARRCATMERIDLSGLSADEIPF